MQSLRRRAVVAAAKVPYLLDLTKLGHVFGTDKVDATHTHNGLAYTDVYEKYFAPWRLRAFTLLELGTHRGKSLRMWDAYFPRAEIVGLDLEPRAVEHAAGFDVTIGSQTDPVVLGGILERHPDIRIVVDDASHITSLTLASFRFIFPRLASGSIYVIEDVAPNSYEDWPGHDPERGANWPAIAANPEAEKFNRRADMDTFLLELIHDCDMGGQVAFVHTWPALVIVGRA